MIAKPTGWTRSLYRKIDLVPSHTMQGFVVQGDGTILASQAWPPTTGALEDTVITKPGVPGTMTAVGAGHGWVLGSLGPDRVVFDWHGTLVSAPFLPERIARTYPGVEPFGGKFQVGSVHAVFDLLHGRVLFYDSASQICTLRSLSDVYSQTDRALSKCTFGNKDAKGTVRLRQSYAVWDMQAFFLIGDAAGGNEVICYDLTTGKEQWRIPVRFTAYAWEEPEGLFLLPAVIGNPAILVGSTCRVPTTGSSFVRKHLIYQLRDPLARFVADPA